jgi:hypothetical protein
MKPVLLALIAPLALLAACDRAAEPPTPVATVPAGLEPLPAGFPPRPGQPGGLAPDQLWAPPATIDPKSADAAADAVRRYFAAIEAKDYAGAQALVGPKVDLKVFERRLSSYPIYRANVGRPGEIEGGAGSLYVEVPIQTYGRMQSGELFTRLETVSMRRVNDVPGATPEQLRWHIDQITVAQPAEAPK